MPRLNRSILLATLSMVGALGFAASASALWFAASRPARGPVICSGHGAVPTSVFVAATCTCDAGYTGALCQTVVPPSGAGAGGEQNWRSKCVSCHGVDGRGNTTAGRKMGILDMTEASWHAARTNQKLEDGIARGCKDRYGKPAMPPFKDKLKLNEIRELVAFLRTLKM